MLLEGTAPTQELVGLLRQALALQPNVAEAHGNLGLLLHEPDLRVPDQRRSAWAEWLQASLQTSEAAIIGLNWQGSPHTEIHILRGLSLPLAEFAPLVKTKGIEFVSLQKGFGSEQFRQASLPIAVSLVSP